MSKKVTVDVSDTYAAYAKPTNEDGYTIQDDQESKRITAAVNATARIRIEGQQAGALACARTHLKIWTRGVLLGFFLSFLTSWFAVFLAWFFRKR